MNKTVESTFRTAAKSSELISAGQWDYCLRLLRHRVATAERESAVVDEDRMLRTILIEQGALTEYQADKLAEGLTKFTLGPYVITDWIGQGGMGQVFKSVHRVMGRECAIKVLPLSRMTTETIDGFIREIRLQGKLDCSYLVRAYDAGRDKNVHYLVTEYVPGMDLRRLVKSRGPLSPEQAASIVMQAALGLQYAHQQGMVHRDVKPGNILVTPDGLAKVSDVGLAGFTSNLFDDPRAGKIVGTADYLSPEQIQTPLEVNAVSDVYSLGCTLYYSVCGKVPFPGGDTKSKIRRHLTATPLHPRNFASDISEEFVEIIADMMEKDPKKRTQTCAEVAARLEPWAVDVAQLAHPRMMRGPWMAPPPPLLDGEPPIVVEEANQETSIHSDGTNLTTTHPPVPLDQPHLTDPSLSGLGSNVFFNANQDEGIAVPLVPKQQPSYAMTIAWTVALLLPPAILIGAIVGFLIGQHF